MVVLGEASDLEFLHFHYLFHRFLAPPHGWQNEGYPLLRVNLLRATLAADRNTASHRL